MYPLYVVHEALLFINHLICTCTDWKPAVLPLPLMWRGPSLLLERETGFRGVCSAVWEAYIVFAKFSCGVPCIVFCNFACANPNDSTVCLFGSTRIQWNLRIKDSLGTEIFFLCWRLSTGGKFCHGKSVPPENGPGGRFWQKQLMVPWTGFDC